MKRIVSLILNNFILFLFVLSVILLSNRVFLFKIANDFNVNDVEIKVFKEYLNKKDKFVFKKYYKNLKKDFNKSLFFKNIKVNKKAKFSKNDFLNKLKNFEKWVDLLYKILGFSVLFLVYKFIKNVKL